MAAVYRQLVSACVDNRLLIKGTSREPGVVQGARFPADSFRLLFRPCSWIRLGFRGAGEPLTLCGFDVGHQPIRGCAIKGDPLKAR